MSDVAPIEIRLNTIYLGEVSEITMGQSPESANLNTNGAGLPFLQGCAEFGRQSPVTTVYCNPPLRIAKSDSILLSVRAPVGTLNWGDQSYCIGRGLAAIRAIPEIADTKYLYYVIAENVSFLHRRSQGSTFLAIGGGDLKFLPVPAFRTKKQKKVARILQTIDKAIEKTEALIDKYQQIKAGLMHDLFTRGIGPDGQLRPPREQAPELYQQTPIGWIPKEWKILGASDVLECLADGPFGSNLKTEHYVQDPGVRVIRLQNVLEYEYNDSDRAYISEKHAHGLVRKKVVSGDVLIAALGEERFPVGRSCSYPRSLPPAVNKADCFCARCNEDIALNTFFMLFLNSVGARHQVYKFEQGVTRPRINTGNLKRLQVPIPTLEEQCSICNYFESLQQRINVERKNLEKLQKQKSGLMHDLLTGKVSVQVESEPEDEPEAAHV